MKTFCGLYSYLFSGSDLFRRCTRFSSLVDVSASFFLSIEFQETGGYALRVQRAAFGRQSDDPFTRYAYLPFMRDTRTIGQGVVVGDPGFAAVLEQNKQAYAEQIVASNEFAVRFPAAPAAFPSIS